MVQKSLSGGAVAGLLVAWGVLSAAYLQAENWPRFRGPDGTGVSEDATIPATWTDKEVAWVVELPGVGHSSPVIWGEHLFVTSATDEGKSRTLYCLDSATGEIRWSKTEKFATNHLHAKNSFASSTPATDGERVYVPYADDADFALLAYDFKGNQVWKASLGPYSSQHGMGVSPIVFEDLVILPNDQRGPSSVVAFNRKTGKQVWKTDREAREASYATPIIVEVPGSAPQLICANGATGLTSLDPRSGELIWKTEPLPQRTVASPSFVGGLVYITCGQGGKGTRLIGVDPTGRGNIEATHIKVRKDKGIPYVPTIVGLGNWVFHWNDNGVVSCYDVRTQEQLWEKRIGGNFSGSPIVVGGKLYCIDESGQVVVLGAGPEFEQLGVMPLGDASHSTPAAANGRLYLRTFHKLTCIGGK